MQLTKEATAANSLMLSNPNYQIHILQTTAPQNNNKDNLQ